MASLIIFSNFGNYLNDDLNLDFFFKKKEVNEDPYSQNDNFDFLSSLIQAWRLVVQRLTKYIHVHLTIKTSKINLNKM